MLRTKVLVTGANGFIGLHLVEALIAEGYQVVGLDWEDHNITSLMAQSPSSLWDALTFVKGDVRDAKICRKACEGVDTVFHHAAIASVPQSFAEPVFTNSVNVGGFLTILTVAANCGVRRFVYASSCAVYGENAEMPLTEKIAPTPISPYASSKYLNELHAQTLGPELGIETIGFRYFNIYGPRQKHVGPYAAVIPKWLSALSEGKPITLFGDGSAIRDFCHVFDVVKSNISAMNSTNPKVNNQIFNVGSGEKTKMTDLLKIFRTIYPNLRIEKTFDREGDIKDSYADISKLKGLLSVDPSIKLTHGILNIARFQSK
jgi:UDP-N-acetylglucosamine 4-epimerase